jgi:hypothetical protein
MIRAVACRALTLVFAVAQFALPGALSVADGVAASGTSETIAHVEDIAHKQCKPPHTAECAVCRYLATGALGNSASQVGFAGTTRVELAASAVSTAHAAPEFGLHSRAPPTLLS